ncbi:CBO0543 family protein [Halalkalibacter nanhaiisediminis]|uniref:Uncharacterized protein n=1 Tax=Halalkalibacter nanhaiisediminis TaxID=688079 RepID=A0A562QT31_9BACI|nr:CBO0543 family protein [Halalkalibacter nanhaiisediminis]TWI59902.1 hypothetical protein IQ10_00325 [Halalkalibacter nanhaiisediminis]
MHIALILFLIYLNIKSQTWKEIRKHAWGIVYVVFINSLYYYLFKEKKLWDLKDKRMKRNTLRALHLFIIMPLLILVFLSNMPQSLFKKAFHLMKWIFISLTFEFVGLKKAHAISFYHGWNLKWSSIIYVLMYTFSYLVTRMPIFTSVLSLGFIVFLLITFKIPIRKELLYGPFVRRPTK